MESHLARILKFSITALLVLVHIGTAAAEIVDFEDWELEPESFWIGPVDEELGIEQPGPFGGTDRIGYVQSGDLSFVNRFNLRFGNWSGFAISNRTDRTTPGVASQTSVFTGSGNGEGDDNYAIAFGYIDNLDPHDSEQLNALPHIDIPTGKRIEQLEITNSTYAALSMQFGDSFAKQFGGPTGTDPDFFRLTVHGTQDEGQLLDETVTFFLADFRFEDDTQDTILDTWETLDLSPLASASRLYFNLDSSDSNAAGMVTPAYFAIDDIVLSDILIGDINNDGERNVHDIDVLCAGIASEESNANFDLNSDGSTTFEDFSLLLAEANTLNGDADFNSAVQFADFLTLSRSFGNTGSWSQGDFDCDGTIGFPDFLILSSNFGLEASSVINAPEPQGIVLTTLAILRLLRRTAIRRPRSVS